MNTRKLMGFLIVAFVFILLFGSVVIIGGWKFAILIWLLAFALSGLLILGVWLATE